MLVAKELLRKRFPMDSSGMRIGRMAVIRIIGV